jgi:hypothetical protein
MTLAALLLLCPLSALASGESVMPYPISALAAIGLMIWIAAYVLQNLLARIVCLGVVLGTIYETWEHINPTDESLMRNFGWWTLLLTSIPVLAGTLTAVGMRLITGKSRGGARRGESHRHFR